MTEAEQKKKKNTWREFKWKEIASYKAGDIVEQV